jgi:hypothetical protein
MPTSSVSTWGDGPTRSCSPYSWDWPNDLAADDGTRSLAGAGPQGSARPRAITGPRRPTPELSRLESGHVTEARQRPPGSIRLGSSERQASAACTRARRARPLARTIFSGRDPRWLNGRGHDHFSRRRAHGPARLAATSSAAPSLRLLLTGVPATRALLESPKPVRGAVPAASLPRHSAAARGPAPPKAHLHLTARALRRPPERSDDARPSRGSSLSRRPPAKTSCSHAGRIAWPPPGLGSGANSGARGGSVLTSRAACTRRTRSRGQVGGFAAAVQLLSLVRKSITPPDDELVTVAPESHPERRRARFTVDG